MTNPARTNSLTKYSLLMLIVIFSGGCSKEPIPQLVTGDWLWEGSSGGIGGMVIKPQPSQRIVLTFSGDGQFSVRQNDTLAYTGTFQITKAHSIYSGKEEFAIKTQQIQTGYQQKIRPLLVIDGVVTALSSTRLSIGDNTYDGFGSSFVKN